MLVNDFLHEFELGEWKALFTHLIRILYASNADLVHEHDARQIDPFGRDTIRRFHRNVSEMKKLAARDFEDILQCCIPVFAGLLPSPHNADISKLLFATCNLHALCKLRMHTESTLRDLEVAISNYGRLIRRFASQTCINFMTYETPKEVRARARRLGRKAADSSQQGSPSDGGASLSRPRKEFSLNRFKLHALGDYPSTIRLFGTTESYSTQRSELQHTKIKNWYSRGSKNHTATKQMTSVDTIERRLRLIDQEVNRILSFETKSRQSEIEVNQPLKRYEMAKEPKRKLGLGHFLKTNSGDPAFELFWPHLNDHLLSRFRDDASEAEENSHGHGVIIKDNILFRHTHARFNYTTYDVRRAQDTISMRSARRNILVAANDTSKTHPFWYARVLGIFHVFASMEGSQAGGLAMKRVDFLWVRWLSLDPRWKGGFKQQQLDRVNFIVNGPAAFGFIDPSDVIRACHLIPDFSSGKTTDLLGPSSVREDDGDFKYYFVNRFLDRDMYMRYRGDGIGHRETEVRDVIGIHNQSEDSDSDVEITSKRTDDRNEAEYCSESGSDEESLMTNSDSGSDGGEDEYSEPDEDGGEQDIIYDI
ncbi:hypothetical protein FRC03_006029 [Tulasnella sp. 419]|nr:hypothetical protein FRC03_006029 [Tulasnella sp. 419]